MIQIVRRKKRLRKRRWQLWRRIQRYFPTNPSLPPPPPTTTISAPSFPLKVEVDELPKKKKRKSKLSEMEDEKTPTKKKKRKSKLSEPE
jgi:hypothetical protein